jgi:hypothetical protein
MYRVALACAAVLALSACASVPNALDAQTRQSLFVKDAAVAWSVKDDKKAEDADYAAHKAEFLGKLETSVENTFRASPAGSDPVRFQIDVKRYSRVGAAMGNLIGGSNAVVADVKVVRESDGRELGVYKDVVGMHASNGGIIGAVVQGITKPDVEGIMANSFAQNLRARFDARK